MLLDVAVAWLRVRKELGPREAANARSYFASLHPGNSVLNPRHGQELAQAYPRIQFKSLGRSLLVVGLGEGADFVQKNCDVPVLSLGRGKTRVWQCLVQRSTAQFGPTNEPVPYLFLAPWLALNKDNYRAYRQDDDLEGRMELLGRVLVGNLLSVAKALALVVDTRLHAEVALDEVSVSLKGEPMTGFIGNFSVNFEIPDYMSLGKGASRGFGTVRHR